MVSVERDLNLNLMKETELCLGLPGGGCKSTEPETPKITTGKRGFSETVVLELNFQAKEKDLNEKAINNAPMEKNLLPCTKDPAKPPAK